MEILHQVSLILRGANDHMLDEMDRALHDALCIVKRTLESNTVNPIIRILEITTASLLPVCLNSINCLVLIVTYYLKMNEKGKKIT